MRRFILLFTVMSVMFTSIYLNVPAYAAAETTKSADAFYEEMDILNALGIFTNLPENAMSTVSRGAFVSGVTELLGASGEFERNKSPFHDVTSSDKYYNEILLAAQLGIVNGDDDGNFRPNDSVTYIEGIVMLMHALNYREQYPYGYLTVASSLQLMDGLSCKNEDLLKAGECARLFVNAGNSYPYIYKTDGNRKYNAADETLFWKVHKIDKAEGILKANEFSSLESSNGVGKNNIVIDSKIYGLYNSSLAIDFLGYNVEAYYKEVNDEAVALHIAKKGNEIKTIAADDVLSVDDGVFTYDLNNRDRKIVIPSDAAVIYNGVLTLKYTDAGGKSILMPEAGNVVFIDNDSDGKYEVISVTSCHDIVVSMVDTNEGIIYNIYHPSQSIKLDDFQSVGSDWSLVDRDGKSIDISELKRYDVITYAESMDGNVFRGILTRKQETGTITRTRVDGRGQIAVINGNEYRINNDFYKNDINVSVPGINDTVTVLFDSDGKIAGTTSASGNSAIYGFYIKSYQEEIGTGIRITARIMDTVGKGGVVKYQLADRVKIDGITYGTKGKNLSDYITVPDSYTRSEDITPQTDNERFLEPFQIIMYKLDSDGRISYIDTQRKTSAEGDNTLTKISPKTSYHFNAPSLTFWFGSAAEYSIIAANTNVTTMKTPTYKNGTNYAGYKCLKGTEIPEGEYSLAAYTTNPRSSVPEMIHIMLDDKDEIDRDSKSAVIKDIYQGVDPEGNVAYFVNYYSELMEYSYYADSDLDLSGIKEGDIVKLNVDSSNIITAMTPLCKYDTTTKLISFTDEAQNLSLATDSNHGGKQSYIGYNYAVDNGILMMAKDLSDTSLSKIDTFPIVNTYAGIYVVKQGGDGAIVEKITVDDMSKLVNYRDANVKSAVYVYLASAVPRMYVIYDGQ